MDKFDFADDEALQMMRKVDPAQNIVGLRGWEWSLFNQ